MGHFAASGVSVPVSEPGLLSPTGADFDPSAAAAAVILQVPLQFFKSAVPRWAYDV